MLAVPSPGNGTTAAVVLLLNETPFDLGPPFPGLGLLNRVQAANMSQDDAGSDCSASKNTMKQSHIDFAAEGSHWVSMMLYIVLPPLLLPMMALFWRMLVLDGGTHHEGLFSILVALFSPPLIMFRVI